MVSRFSSVVLVFVEAAELFVCAQESLKPVLFPEARGANVVSANRTAPASQDGIPTWYPAAREANTSLELVSIEFLRNWWRMMECKGFWSCDCPVVTAGTWTLAALLASAR